MAPQFETGTKRVAQSLLPGGMQRATKKGSQPRYCGMLQAAHKDAAEGQKGPPQAFCTGPRETPEAQNLERLGAFGSTAGASGSEGCLKLGARCAIGHWHRRDIFARYSCVKFPPKPPCKCLALASKRPGYAKQHDDRSTNTIQTLAAK